MGVVAGGHTHFWGSLATASCSYTHPNHPRCFYSNNTVLPPQKKAVYFVVAVRMLLLLCPSETSEPRERPRPTLTPE